MSNSKIISKSITFITGNPHKVKEARGILNNLGITLEHADIGYPEIQGDLEDVAGTVHSMLLGVLENQ